MKDIDCGRGGGVYCAVFCVKTTKKLIPQFWPTFQLDFANFNLNFLQGSDILRIDINKVIAVTQASFKLTYNFEY